LEALGRVCEEGRQQFPGWQRPGEPRRTARELAKVSMCAAAATPGDLNQNAREELIEYSYV